MLSIDFSQDLVLLAIHIEVTHTLTTKCVLQGLTNITCTHTKHSCFIPVNNNSCFRFCKFKIHVGHSEVWTRIHSFQKRRNKFLKLFNVRGLKNILYRHSSTSSSEGRLLLNKCSSCIFIPYSFGNFISNFHL